MDDNWAYLHFRKPLIFVFCLGLDLDSTHLFFYAKLHRWRPGLFTLRSIANTYFFFKFPVSSMAFSHCTVSICCDSGIIVQVSPVMFHPATAVPSWLSFPNLEAQTAAQTLPSTLRKGSLREELQTLRKEHAERVQALQGSQLDSMATNIKQTSAKRW